MLITRGDRVELFAQTVESMQRNAADWSRHRLLVVFDGTEEERHQWEGQTHQYGLPLFGLVHTGRQVGVGGAKNCGAEHLWVTPDSRRAEVDLYKDLVMFSDSDMYYLPGWDTELTFFMNGPYFTRKGERVTQLGGWRHPFHVKGREVGTNMVDRATVEVDAVTGNCFVMRWADWLQYGPFDQNALGPGQSEDFALSRKIIAAGGLCATLDPPVAVHCGLVNSSGEPAVGWQAMEEQITEQLGAMAEEDRAQVLIARPPKPGWIERIESMEREAGIKPTVDPNPTQFRISDEALARLNRAAETVFDPKFKRGSEFTIGGTQFQSVGELLLQNSSQAVAEHMRRVHGFVGANLGSGQRRFDVTEGWLNIDTQNIAPDRVPDIVLDCNKLDSVFSAGTFDLIVLHHVLEHFGCGEADGILRAAWSALRPGGSLLVFVPDLRKLAGRWLNGEIDDYTFMVNAYGAYMGDEADRHKWGASQQGLKTALQTALPDVAVGSRIIDFDWRQIVGADIAKDWWIAGVEAIKGGA